MTWEQYEDECEYWEGYEDDPEYKGELDGYYDADRPPLTRWQDVFTMVRSRSLRDDGTELALTRDRSRNPKLPVAKIVATVHTLQIRLKKMPEIDVDAYFS